MQLGVSQEKNKTPNDSITALEEVILLEAAKTRAATGIVASTVVGATVFKNYSPIDAVSAINQISGVYALSGALNTNRITIRGVGARTLFGTDKLRLYYNDIPVTNGTGTSTIEAFDLENLNSIEVIKGPKGTAFGANLGGAILIKSKLADIDYTGFSNSFTVGSYNLLKNNLGFTHRTKDFSLELHYNHLETDGYRQNNSFDRDGILLNTAYHLNDRNTLGLLVNYIDYTAQIPSTISQTTFDEDPRQAAANWLAAQGFEANKYTLLGVYYTHTYGTKLKQTTSLFYTYLDHFEPRPFNILDEFTNGYGFRTRFQGSFGTGTNEAQYSFGAEFYRDEYDWSTFENNFEDNNGNGSLQGNQLSDNKEFRRQFNAFASLNYKLTEAFEAQAGISLNKTNYDFRDRFNTGANNTSAKRNFDAILLPSLNLKYQFSGKQSVYANISRGFSNPGLEETLTPDGVINPDIVQETGTNYEVGTLLNLDQKRFSIQLALYRMNINNLLVAQRIGEDQFVGINAGSTKHQGIEADLQYNLRLSSRLQVRPFVSYTFNDHSFVEFIDGDNDFSGNPLTGVPKHRIQSGLQLRHSSGWYWNTTHQYVGEIPLRDANTLSSDAFAVVRMRLGYQTEIFSSLILGLDFGIDNVFDTTYAQSVLINAQSFGGAEPRYFSPGNGRNYYGSLQLRYQL